MRRFEEGIDELLEATPVGFLVGSVEMDQVYAHYQHEHPEFKHPRGGQAFFLRDALYTQIDMIMTALALSVTKKRLPQAMAEGMERVSDLAYQLSPVEYTPLRRSTHPTVALGDHDGSAGDAVPMEQARQRTRRRAGRRVLHDAGDGVEEPGVRSDGRVDRVE